MTDADAFLEAIWATPDDDLPRLVYADWLEERGHAAYAEFMRLQCAVARVQRFSPEANELWKAISPVWRRLEDEWWPAVMAVPGLDASDFHRGFYRKRLYLEDPDFLPFAPSWPDELFFVEVDLRVWEGYLANSTLQNALISSSLFGRCRELRLRGWPGRELLSEAQFTHLNVLNLDAARVDDGVASGLLENPTLARLERLVILDEPETSPEVRGWLSERFGPRLQWVLAAFDGEME